MSIAMTTLYRVYSNSGKGGPVDYSNPVATLTDTGWDVGPLSAPGDYTFAVRAFDSESGLEESNTNVRIRIALDADGRDISGLPNPPIDVEARRAPGVGCRVTWLYRPREGWGLPDGFEVRMAPAEEVSAPPVTVTVPFTRGRIAFSCDLSGVGEPDTSRVTVRGFNVSGFGPAGGPSGIASGRAMASRDVDPVVARSGAAALG